MFERIKNCLSPLSVLYFVVILSVIIKLLLTILFSSGYQNQLFLPFVTHYLSFHDNPWQYFYTFNRAVEFPYHPVMLYLLSFFYLPVHLLNLDSVIWQNFFFKLPLLLSDVLITYLLIKLFPSRKKKVLLFYAVSPIILYANYMHSQLDLIPTAMLFLSIYFLINKRHIFWVSLFFGIAISTKSHVVAAYPLMAYFILRNYSLKDFLFFLFAPALIFFGFTYPYLFSDGYKYLVLSNPKQMMIYDIFFKIGSLKLYPVIITTIIIYSRFFIFKKINNELFFTFLGILFSVFVLLIFPAPAWYIWMLPFLSVFLIKYYERNSYLLYFYIAFNVIYLIFFIGFYLPDHQDLIFLNSNVSMKIHDEKLANIFYTLLETLLFATLYLLYKFGITSNLLYKKTGATIIGIGGDSGVGKSTLLNDLKTLLGKKFLELEGDADHRWERDDDNWDTFTHLNPKANLLHTQADNLLILKIGNAVFRRDYNHKTGKFTDPVKIKPKDFIVLSGLHTFYLPKMRKIIDFKIYIDTDEQLRRHWKIVRDLEIRGYQKEKIIEQIEKRMDDAKRFIYPQKEFADLVINYFTEDEFEVGGNTAEPHIKLKLIFDASIHLENLLNKFANKDFSWDYSDDLKHQIIVFHKPPKQLDIKEIGDTIIFNLEEIIPSNTLLLHGYRGAIQLIVLLIISEKMKEVV
ncbi:MAG: hypothetical protein A2X42_07495 [Candidatus Margulisbacteria bacterium GWF2_38_17]|nr:MAG: hypothetical protein A2X43_03550 [Candidatus Margulisbacteria bacterium GWD2_39_127]OGI02516.1 MAG: hypothetical protein A2X42_07495 [Candidatus Margulisbacteria bacterium GWF2_38_17]OGI11012.1 MAG: hypothetical protein A2X41_02020 [Candidatus Margulisbacteria bacterium GWE2_39_32]